MEPVYLAGMRELRPRAPEGLVQVTQQLSYMSMFDS